MIKKALPHWQRLQRQSLLKFERWSKPEEPGQICSGSFYMSIGDGGFLKIPRPQLTYLNSRLENMEELVLIFQSQLFKDCCFLISDRFF